MTARSTQSALERLDIDLRNFDDDMIDVSPSSAATSLPTPETKPASLANVEVQPNLRASWLPDFGESRIEPPGAPLLKDYDSFSQGSAVGSFGSLASWGELDMNDSIYSVNSSSSPTNLSHDKSPFIEEWREKVCNTASVPSSPHKRRRSPSFDHARRTRARGDSSPSPPTPCETFSELDPPLDYCPETDFPD